MGDTRELKVSPNNVYLYTNTVLIFEKAISHSSYFARHYTTVLVIITVTSVNAFIVKIKTDRITVKNTEQLKVGNTGCEKASSQSVAHRCCGNKNPTGDIFGQVETGPALGRAALRWGDRRAGAAFQRGGSDRRGTGRVVYHPPPPFSGRFRARCHNRAFHCPRTKGLTERPRTPAPPHAFLGRACRKTAAASQVGTVGAARRAAFHGPRARTTPPPQRSHAAGNARLASNGREGARAYRGACVHRARQAARGR